MYKLVELDFALAVAVVEVEAEVVVEVVEIVAEVLFLIFIQVKIIDVKIKISQY